MSRFEHERLRTADLELHGRAAADDVSRAIALTQVARIAHAPGTIAESR
jgi:hypothetical protein